MQSVERHIGHSFFLCTEGRHSVQVSSVLHGDQMEELRVEPSVSKLGAAHMSSLVWYFS